MKKVTIEIAAVDAEDELEIRRLLSARGAYSALYEIGQQVFRPARKHGYPDGTLSELLTRIDQSTDGAGSDLIHELEKLYFKIIEEEGVSLEDVNG